MRHRLAVVVDIDPAGPGTYPENRIEPPPRAAETWEHSLKSVEVVESKWGGKAVITAHTSPLFRWDFFQQPYLELYARAQEAGAAIAIHPHEDRDDGGTRYGERGHMRDVISEACQRLEDAEVEAAVFRSSFFAFADHLPPLLSELGIRVSMCSAPALRAKEEGATWSPQWGDDFTDARFLCKKNYLHADCDHETWDIYEIPLGWSGKGTELKEDYLFNEGSTLESLIDVWEAVRERGDERGEPQTVCFLCHGFGLAQVRWREQALDFVEYVRRQGGQILSASELVGGTKN